MESLPVGWVESSEPTFLTERGGSEASTHLTRNRREWTNRTCQPATLDVLDGVTLCFSWPWLSSSVLLPTHNSPVNSTEAAGSRPHPSWELISANRAHRLFIKTRGRT